MISAKKISLLVVIFASVVIVSCQKSEDNFFDNSDGPLKFKEITISVDTIARGGKADLEAKVTGKHLSFEWSCPTGSILGNGPKVTFVAPVCTYGNFMLSCKVVDANHNQDTKSLLINVKENN